MLLGARDVLGSFWARWIRIVDNERLAGLQASFNESPLAISRTKHVQVDANMRIEESESVEAGFARSLSANENHHFHCSVHVKLDLDRSLLLQRLTSMSRGTSEQIDESQIARFGANLQLDAKTASLSRLRLEFGRLRKSGNKESLCLPNFQFVSFPNCQKQFAGYKQLQL